MKSKLDKLITLCKCEVSISINEHTIGYTTVEKHLKDHEEMFESLEISDELRKLMIEKNQLVRIIFYPDTPIGSYDVWHYDVELALDQCLSIMEEEMDERREQSEEELLQDGKDLHVERQIQDWKEGK